MNSKLGPFTIHLRKETLISEAQRDQVASPQAPTFDEELNVVASFQALAFYEEHDLVANSFS